MSACADMRTHDIDPFRVRPQSRGPPTTEIGVAAEENPFLPDVPREGSQGQAGLPVAQHECDGAPDARGRCCRAITTTST